MANADTVAEVGKKFQTLGSLMDERIRRLWAACEAAALGRGGVTAVAEATGMSRTTIRAGIVELQDPQGRREAEPAGVANVSVSATGSSSKTWRPWSSRPPVETLNLRCAGPARVLVISRTRWLAADIRSVTARWLLCFMDWTTVCRPTERRERGLLIPTATPSSSTSARKSVRSKHSNSRSYQSIRKRRNWSEISEMSAWNGSPKGRRTRSASTTSKTRNLARRFRTASMTSPTTKVG